MRVQVSKWGNSLAFRVPGVFAKKISLSQGDAVDLDLQGNRLVITSLKKEYPLKTMLSGINKNNLHRESPSSPALGKEIW